MRQLYFRITILLLMVVVGASLQAQHKLYLHAKDGTKTSFPINDIRKLTFPNRTIMLYQNDKSTQAFPFSELRQARFTEFFSGSNSLGQMDDTSLLLFPNPVNSELTLRISSESDAAVEIRIMDVQGKAVSVSKEHFLPGINQITLQLSNLPQGLYVCRVNNGKRTETRKFLKN